MKLSNPIQLGMGAGWSPSVAFRQWISNVTAGVNGIGTVWRGETVRYAVADGVSTSPAEVGSGWGAYGAFSSAAVAASTNYLASQPRLLATTAAGANSERLQASSYAHYWLGNAAGLGGFYYEQVFGVVTTQTTMRVGVGLGAAVPSVAAADPSAAVSAIFMGCDDTDTAMQIMHNDSAGTCTKVSLGADFPKTNNATYKLVLEAGAKATAVDFQVTRLDSTAYARGSLATNLPANTAFLQPFLVVGNGGTAAAASIAFVRFLTEQ